MRRVRMCSYRPGMRAGARRPLAGSGMSWWCSGRDEAVTQRGTLRVAWRVERAVVLDRTVSETSAGLAVRSRWGAGCAAYVRQGAGDGSG
jgi:hypothetical protein